MAFPVNPEDGQIYGDYYYDAATDSWQQNQSRSGYNNEDILELDYPGDEPIQGNAELFELSTQDFISSENRKPTLYKSVTMEPTEISDWALNPHCWHLFPKENLIDKAPTNGLVAYYSMKNISGTTVTDDSGNGYDGTLAVTPTTLVGPPDGTVLDLNGTSQYMELPDEVRPMGRSWTISFLYKADDWTGESFRTIFGGHGLGSDGAQGGIALTRYLDRLVFHVYDDSTKFSCNMPRVNFREGSWHHIVITVADDGEIYIYNNGGIVGHNYSAGQVAPSEINWGTNKFRFGFQGIDDTTRHYADGQISEIRIYNRALTKSEVRAFTSRRVATAGFWDNRQNLLEDPDRMGSSIWSKARVSVSDLPTGNWRGFLESELTANTSSGLNYVRQNTISLDGNKGAISVLYKLKTPTDGMATYLIRESDDSQKVVSEVNFSLDTPFTRNDDLFGSSNAEGEISDFIWIEPDIFYFANVGRILNTTTYKVYFSCSNASNTAVNSILTSQVIEEAFNVPFVGDFMYGQGLVYPKVIPNNGTIVLIMKVPYTYNTHPTFSRIFELNEQDQSAKANYYSANMMNLTFEAYSPTATNIELGLRDSGGTNHDISYNLTATDFFQNRYQWTQIAVTWENFNSGLSNASVNIYINDNLATSLSSTQIDINLDQLSIGRNGANFTDQNKRYVPESVDGWISQAVLDERTWTQQEIQDAYEMWYAYGHKWFATNRLIGKNYFFKKDQFGNKWPPE